MNRPRLDFGILLTAFLAVLAIVASTPADAELLAHSPLQLTLTALFSHR